ncbi:MAG: NUDIX domain-containing protein [Acidimicrobiia bacterium]|nr:NUDIX domain-containing protein [Acidimicrobiia bacterium]
MTSSAGVPRFLAEGDAALARSTELVLARTIVAGFTSDDPAAVDHRDRTLAFVDAHPDALHRSCVEGHLTGSALVVDARTERILLLFHAKIRRWLQPGGHADGDANLPAVALKEATEETGISGLRVHPTPIDIDIHRVRARDETDHDHHDIRFLVVAPDDAEVVTNHESEGARWVTLADLADLADLEPDAGTLRMAHSGLALLRAL